MAERRRMTGPLRDVGERVRWQAMTECRSAPPPYPSPSEGYLLLTSQQFFYVPDDKTVVPIPFSDIDQIEFSKVGRRSVVITAHMTSAEDWTFDVHPLAARVMKRRYRNWTRQ
jgi:hypothetical protein